MASGRRVVAANSAADDDRGRPLELLNGAYAEFLLVPERIARVNLLPVPAGLAPEVAAMVEPLACCLRGVERAGIEAGDRVAIVGAGPIGLMLCACVVDAGGRPELVGGRPERRALAPDFGAVPGDGEDAAVVIEAAGTEDGWQRALELVRPGGTVVFFGGRERGSELRVDSYRLHYEELTLRGAFHHAPRHVRAALAFLASGACPLERLSPTASASKASRPARRSAARLPEGRGHSLGRDVEPGGERRLAEAQIALTIVTPDPRTAADAKWIASAPRSRCRSAASAATSSTNSFSSTTETSSQRCRAGRARGAATTAPRPSHGSSGERS